MVRLVHGTVEDHGVRSNNIDSTWLVCLPLSFRNIVYVAPVVVLLDQGGGGNGKEGGRHQGVAHPHAAPGGQAVHEEQEEEDHRHEVVHGRQESRHSALVNWVGELDGHLEEQRTAGVGGACSDDDCKVELDLGRCDQVDVWVAHESEPDEAGG